jgi:chromosome segregation ATPase
MKDHAHRADEYWRRRAAAELQKQVTAIKAHRDSLETLARRIANRVEGADAAVAKLREVADDLKGMR